MSKPIPPDMREQLADDPVMLDCIITDGECAGVIQWHHGQTYAGRRINERWAIVPICAHHHQREAKYRAIINAFMRMRIYQFGAYDDYKRNYPKATLL